MITYDTDASIYSPTLAVRECIESAFRVARELLPEIPADITVEFKDRPEQSGVGVSGYPRTVGVVVLAWDTEFPGAAPGIPLEPGLHVRVANGDGPDRA